MAINYPKLAATAKRLVEANGKPCTFSRKGTVPANSAQPWRAPTTTAGVGGPVSYPDIIAVVTQEWIGDDKSSIGRPGVMMLIVAAESFPAGVDPTKMDRVDDGTTVWKICKMMPVAPGVLPIVYTSEVEG